LAAIPGRSLTPDLMTTWVRSSTLAYVIKETEGRRTYLTCQEADMAARIRRGRPTMPLEAVWLLVRLYTIRQEEKQSTQDLDAQLAVWDDLTQQPAEVCLESWLLIQRLWPETPEVRRVALPSILAAAAIPGRRARKLRNDDEQENPNG
jgi:hypothetical protein